MAAAEREEAMEEVGHAEQLIDRILYLEGTDLRFDLGPNDEKAAEFTISAPGEYTYKCTLTGHGNMKGTLTVR